MSELNVDALDPGVRDLVVWLNANGFETTDSGDGVSKPPVGRVFEHPHVFMQVEPEALVAEARRLVRLLAERGVQCGPVGRDEPCVDASFDPSDGSAIIGLHFVTSDMVPGGGT